jgi:Bacterial Ig-like domain
MRRILVLLTTMVAGVLLASGVALAAVVPEAEPNDSIAAAQAIEATSFDLTQDPNITDSTTVPHATVNGTGNNTVDYYSFTVTQAGTVGTFDIDRTESGPGFGYDSYMALFDSSGTLFGFGNDGPADPGSTDDSGGAGMSNDPFEINTFFTPGTYYIGVGECCGTDGAPTPVPNTATYDLHVSIAVPPPPADTTPPTVTFKSPTPGGTASSTDNVTATFSEPVQNLTSSTFILERNIAVKKAPPKFVRVDASVSLEDIKDPEVVEDALATLNPAQDLPKGAYRATITTGVTDQADPANPLEDPVVWTFTVKKLLP